MLYSDYLGGSNFLYTSITAVQEKPFVSYHFLISILNNIQAQSRIKVRIGQGSNILYHVFEPFML